MEGLSRTQWDQARDFCERNAAVVGRCRSFGDLIHLARKTEARDTDAYVRDLRDKRRKEEFEDSVWYDCIDAKDRDMESARQGLTEIAASVGATWARRDLAKRAASVA